MFSYFYFCIKVTSELKYFGKTNQTFWQKTKKKFLKKVEVKPNVQWFLR